MTITNPYISVEINEKNLAPIYEAIAQELEHLEVPYEKTSRVHMSIAYIIGEHEEEKIYKIIKKLTNASFKLQAVGFNVVYSEYFNADLIILTLQKGDDFEYSIQELSKENLEIKQDFNGNHFEAHITLFKVPKGFLTENDKELLCRWLELVSMDIAPKVKLYGETISVFNCDRKLINSFNIHKKE